MTDFRAMLTEGYGFQEPSLVLGAALQGSVVYQEPKVRLPLAMSNRHGLIAGATGTRKTRTLQLLTDELQADIRSSDLIAEYGRAIDRESAREILAARMAKTAPSEAPQTTGNRQGRTMAEVAGDVVTSSVGRTVVREVVRGLFGLLGAKPPRTTRRRSRW